MPQSRQATRQLRWRRRKDARPREIIAAALALFVERGYAATRLDEVAHRAGVTKGTVYLYFANKEALFRAVVQEVVLPELERAEHRVKTHSGSARDLLSSLVYEWWHAVGESHLCGIPKLVIAEAGNFPELAKFFLAHVVRRARKLFAHVLKRGIARGEFRTCDVNHAVRVLLAPMVFAAIWERSLGPYDSELYDVRKYLDTHVEIFLRGISKRPSDS